MNEHGTRTEYLAGCRCMSCRYANTVYQRERKRAQGVRVRRSALELSMMRGTADVSWMDNGACKGKDPNIWHPEIAKGGPNSRAIALRRSECAVLICRQCPVMAECREYAMKHGEPCGVWGGLDEVERRRMRVQSA